MKQKTSLIRFVMAISLIFVSGFTVKGFSSAAVVNSSAHVELNTSHSYNPDKMHEYDFEDANTQGGDDNVVKEPPHGWQTFGFLQIRAHFSCNAFDYVLFKPPSMKEWQMILDAYNKEVDSSYKFDDIVPPTQGYFSFEEISGSLGAPPFYAKSSNMGIRRGLFASRDMRKGEVVHDGTDSDVVFPDAMAYRRFVFALPRKAACDITEWTWAQRLEQNGPMKIMLAINISAMLSTWQSTGFTSEDANVLPEPESEGSTSHLYYATRDIKRGEEILTDSTFRDWTNFAATDLGM
mmetsp:Transcript_20853/g.31800  ORF Transcript_20853/g.31800 Transcript_20853/m.31800 type:complete len:293 (-) Transcript_20853:218-1096(-)